VEVVAIKMSSTTGRLTTDSSIARHVNNAISAVTAIQSSSPDLIPAIDNVRAVVQPPGQRTLQDVRLQVARSIAARAIRKAQVVDGSKTGVVFTLVKSRDESFLKNVAMELRDILSSHSFLFALTTDTNTTPGRSSNNAKPTGPSTLVITGSSPEFVQRAKILTCSKFLGRTVELSVTDGGGLWIAGIHGMGSSSFDELALKDIVTKSVRNLMEPLAPPPNSFSADQLVSNARARLERLTPEGAYAELVQDDTPTPVFLIDIRSESQRRIEGGIQGSIVIDRNELEWRLDPRSPSRLNVVDRFDIRLILMCRDGKASSLAAYAVHQLGLVSTTDIIGGYLAWREKGLPSDVNALSFSSIDSYA
jgi:rhodanese-related sulfurtransferase